MPCDSGQGMEFDDREAREANQKADKLEALLCGLMTALDKANILQPMLNQFDGKEAGHSVDALHQWWEEHKVKDDARRLREAQAKHEAEVQDKESEQRVEQVTNAVLALINPLTPEERLKIGKNLQERGRKQDAAGLMAGTHFPQGLNGLYNGAYDVKR